MEEKERRDVEEKKANNAANCHGRSDYLMPEATWHVM